MIVGSVLLVLVAGVLLGLGLVRLAEPLLYSSIGVSALAAVTLVVGVRRLTAARAGRAAITVAPVVTAFRATPRPVGEARPRPVGRAAVTTQVEAAAPAPASSEADALNADLAALDDADPTVPADEPAPEPVAEAELVRIGRMTAEVVVVDARPRFHLADCLHLLGLDSERLPAAEAVELGFTPCVLCRPAAALLLLADADDGDNGDAGRSSA